MMPSMSATVRPASAIAASAACEHQLDGQERRAAHVVGLADADDRGPSPRIRRRRSRVADATATRRRTLATASCSRRSTGRRSASASAADCRDAVTEARRTATAAGAVDGAAVDRHGLRVAEREHPAVGRAGSSSRAPVGRARDRERGRARAPAEPGSRAEVVRVAEGEHAAVAREQPVARCRSRSRSSTSPARRASSTPVDP